MALARLFPRSEFEPGTETTRAMAREMAVVNSLRDPTLQVNGFYVPGKHKNDRLARLEFHRAGLGDGASRPILTVNTDRMRCRFRKGSWSEFRDRRSTLRCQRNSPPSCCRLQAYPRRLLRCSADQDHRKPLSDRVSSHSKTLGLFRLPYAFLERAKLDHSSSN